MTSDPELVIFTGPMFGSKTTKMLASVDRYRYQNRGIIAFKPMMDSRYADSEIVTHSGGRMPAICVKAGEDMVKYLQGSDKDYDVIAIDEAFMIDNVAKAVLELFRNGKTILVSSLQLSASGNIFSEVRDMMPWATKIEVCPAVCPITGRDAFYTHRKVEDLDEIVIGGAELYEPRCWEHHGFMNQRD